MTKTILFKVPRSLGFALKVKLAQKDLTLQEWGEGAARAFVNGTNKNGTTKPLRRATVK
jgi:hypothetical protein